MRPNGVSDASRSTAKFHCPKAPAIWGENCELLSFFLTRLFSRSSGHPGDRCLSQVNMRRNDVSDASRSTDRFHCPQGPTIWGENRELLIFFRREFFQKVWAARRPVPESAAYEAKRRLGRVSQHRKVPLPPGPSNLGGKLRAVKFFFDETFFKKFWSSRRSLPESGKYAAQRRLGRRITARFHCPQAPTIWGENRELLFCLTRSFSESLGSQATCS